MSKLATKGNRFNIEQSLENMVKQRVTDPDTKVLQSWCQVISSGGLVTCEKKRMLLQSCSVGSSIGIKLNTAFVERHGSLANSIRQAVKNSKGKWLLDKPVKNTQPTYEISRKRDVVSFLLHARRVALADAESALVASF